MTNLLLLSYKGVKIFIFLALILVSRHLKIGFKKIVFNDKI